MAHIGAFIAIAAVVICIPGPDTALIVRNTLFGGRANGIRTAGGIFTGNAVWTLAASAGIAALVAASHPLFTALRVFGAAYLVWLGLSTLRGHRGIDARPHRGSGYRQGILSNLGNPKIAVFFTSLLPQFGTGFVQLAALGLLFSAMGAFWLTGYAVVVSHARRALIRSRRVLDVITGSVLVAFGVRLATERS